MTSQGIFGLIFYRRKKQHVRALERFLTDTPAHVSLEVVQKGQRFGMPFEEICDKEDIKYEFPPPDSHEFNGHV